MPLKAAGRAPTALLELSSEVMASAFAISSCSQRAHCPKDLLRGSGNQSAGAIRKWMDEVMRQSSLIFNDSVPLD